MDTDADLTPRETALISLADDLANTIATAIQAGLEPSEIRDVSDAILRLHETEATS